MKLILINGQQATGKSSTAALLGSQLENSAVIDTDSLIVVNPWDFDSLIGTLAVKNVISLFENFKNAGYENIIISGLTRNQESLDNFLKELKFSGGIIFVWLRASKQERGDRMKNRNRDASDKPEWFDFGDNKIPDIDLIKVPGKYIDIQTDTKNELTERSVP